MQIHFLGTNGWFDSQVGHTPCVLIKSKQANIILDAGFGFTELSPVLDWDKPVFLFLSHFHLDHTVGLHALPLYQFTGGLKIFGPQPAQDSLETILRAPYSANVRTLKYPVEIHDDEAYLSSLPFKITALPLIHTAPCMGYRLELDGKKIAYCTDTGEYPNAITLGRNSDLLITECSLLPGEDDHGWPHLNPEMAAGLARKAQAERLVLMHFDASKYRSLEDRKIAEETARRIFPETVAAYDGMTIQI